MLVEFRLNNGSHITLNGVEFDGPIATGRDRKGRPYTLDCATVVAERMLRDEHGWVGGKKRRRG